MNDQIYTSVPVNKTAALVVGNNPNDETNSNYGQIYMSLIKPPTIPFYSRDKKLNLHGLTIGKLTVIGAFIKQTPKKKTKWVVQCKCGYYSIRVSNTIRKKIANNEYDECARCSHTANSVRHSEYYKLKC